MAEQTLERNARQVSLARITPVAGDMWRMPCLAFLPVASAAVYAVQAQRSVSRCDSQPLGTTDPSVKLKLVQVVFR